MKFHKLFRISKFGLKYFNTKAVIANKFDINELNYTDFELKNQKLSNKQFLVKTNCCPINPLDLLKIKGKIPAVKAPFVIGTEFSGIIADASEENKHYIGLPVSSICREGSMKNYNVVQVSDTIIFPKDFLNRIDEISSAYVNPLTALYLLTESLNKIGPNSQKSLINSAANSHLGKIIIKLCELRNIETINIVRSQNSLVKLKNELNPKYVLDSSHENFKQELSALSQEKGTLIALDCVGGNLTSILVNSLVKGGTTLIYGSLESEIINNINGVLLRNQNKKIEGFSLFKYLEDIDQTETIKLKGEIIKNFSIFKSTHNKKYKVENIKDAFHEYMNDMSAGKILIDFN